MKLNYYYNFFFNKLSAYEVAPGLSTTLQFFTSSKLFISVISKSLRAYNSKWSKTPKDTGPSNKYGDNYKWNYLCVFWTTYLSFVLPIDYFNEIFFCLFANGV